MVYAIVLHFTELYVPCPLNRVKFLIMFSTAKETLIWNGAIEIIVVQIVQIDLT